MAGLLVLALHLIASQHQVATGAASSAVGELVGMNGIFGHHLLPIGAKERSATVS